MGGYRLYFLENDHVKDVITLECADDDAAITKVQEYANRRPMELWSGARVVRCFPADAGKIAMPRSLFGGPSGT